MLVIDSCCPDPHAPSAPIGEFPFGRCPAGRCPVCGCGNVLPHRDWCPGVGYTLHRLHRHRRETEFQVTLAAVKPEHGSIARFEGGCRCLRCLRAWLDSAELRPNRG